MSDDYDVIVVGAGPGGATASRWCARGGLRTLILEKERFPRYKVCGGCLSLKTVRLLDFDLGSVVESVIYGVKFTYTLRDPLLIDSHEPIGFMVMRERFDQFLVKHALEAGVELLEGRKVLAAQKVGGKIEVEWEGGGRARCDYLVGADGAGSVVARSFALLPSRKAENGIGLQSEIPYRQMTEIPQEERRRVHLDFGRVPNGYGWVFPKKDGLSVGVGGNFRRGEKANLQDCFTRFVKDLNLIRGEEAERVTGHRLPCFYDENFRLAKENVLLVGDAGYLMDPLTGEGVYHAVRSGMLAAEAILHSKEKGEQPAAFYQGRVHETLLRELKLALHISRIIYRFPKISYRTLKRYPELGTLCAQVLGGQIDYQAFVERVKERIRDVLEGKVGAKLRKAMANS
jgi:geranylgeranyl reductase family protein